MNPLRFKLVRPLIHALPSDHPWGGDDAVVWYPIRWGVGERIQRSVGLRVMGPLKDHLRSRCLRSPSAL